MPAEIITTSAPIRMPSWYIPHGAGPCFFMDWHPPTAWERMAGFLRGLAATLPARPRAIVVVSAHWLAPVFGVTANARPDLIYDYAGFPAHTYALRYPAPGEPAWLLIIGSGMSFHNMRGYGDPRYGSISDDFDRWLTAAVEAEPIRRAQALAGWADAPSARLSHPPGGDEHLLPLMAVAGAAGDDHGRRVFTDRVLEPRSGS
ncbi:DODA-type extradiol aromatic ring-opening family dioxygenase [Thiocapsa rosea]|uniref:Catalytic LigB subunit of aromatic ring-opening dioxygenase n=1 Tax=Thiocapsa rosea TaxID=69360 RepID=A0A495VAQ9_9GAMM|nr:class III extradiol ring-cleavage dioxygenase [Thiocapsa rosea]RKT45535.1 catalytic LigB subunit of aromatic ring-opening dioxygenase [Thiocapsa rosea]